MIPFSMCLSEYDVYGYITEMTSFYHLLKSTGNTGIYSDKCYIAIS